MNKTILIRCDYFNGSGAGHIRRILTLYYGLIKRGIKPILVLDDFDGIETRNLDINIEKVKIEKFNEEKDAKEIVFLAKKYKTNLVFGDSYRISNYWVKLLKKSGLKVICIDELGVLNETDLSINYTPLKNSEIEKRIKISNLVGPEFFITESKKLSYKKREVKHIIAHAGGNGDYSKAENIYKALNTITQKLSISVDWICTNEYSLNSLKKIIQITSKDRILEWVKGNNSIWSFYDIVVGPSSTSVYESIMQGTLPISFPINKNQLTDREDWLTLGHALHINKSELENISLINHLIEIAIKENDLFLKMLAKYSSMLDGKGTEKIIDNIEGFINNRIEKISLSHFKPLVNGINKCPFFLAESFLNARNSPDVRKMSTNPKHIISWSEHLNWWVKAKTKKFLLVEEHNPSAYFWLKNWHLQQGKFITAGWFPASNATNLFSILKIMDWQINYFSKKYPGYIWVATVNETNKGAMALNKRFGFVSANKSTLEVIPILFPGTQKNFKVFELLCK